MVFEGLEAVAAQMGYKSGYAKGYSKGFKVRPLPSSLLSLLGYPIYQPGGPSANRCVCGC
jgi:hypothetical protein